MQYWQSQVDDEIRHSKSEKTILGFHVIETEGRRARQLTVCVIAFWGRTVSSIMFLFLTVVSATKARVSAYGVNYRTKHSPRDLAY